MAGMIHQLIELLEIELNNYSKLLEFSKQKVDIIVKNDVNTLKTITRQEDEITSHNLGLEKKREELISDIAMVLNKDKSTLTLEALAEILSNQEAEQLKLRELNDKFKVTLKELKNFNEQNGILIKQSLDYIDFNINVMQSLQSLPSISYQYSGKEMASEGRNFFDAKQ